MSNKRPRTDRRIAERDAKKLVRDKERLFLLELGGSQERPMEVSSAAVIEIRVEAMPCVQCDTPQYRIREHASIAAGLRRLDVICRNCGAPRSLWFRIVLDEPN
jgi:hypothetical protein